MQIRIKSTGDVVSEQSFRTLNSNTSLPEQLTEEIINALGGDIIFEGPQATVTDVYQYSQYGGLEEVNGKWYTKYVLGPIFTDNDESTATEQEQAYKLLKDNEQANSVRSTRGQKLKDSDWTQVIDAPVDQASWATYRQALRDLTSQKDFPWNIEWPVQPE